MQDKTPKTPTNQPSQGKPSSTTPSHTPSQQPDLPPLPEPDRYKGNSTSPEPRRSSAPPSSDDQHHPCVWKPSFSTHNIHRPYLEANQPPRLLPAYITKSQPLTRNKTCSSAAFPLSHCSFQVNLSTKPNYQHHNRYNKCCNGKSVCYHSVSSIFSPSLCLVSLPIKLAFLNWFIHLSFSFQLCLIML